MKLYMFLVMTVFFLASCNEKEEPQPKQQTNVMSAYKALRSYWEHHDVLPKPEVLTDEEIFLNLEKKVSTLKMLTPKKSVSQNDTDI